MRLIDADGFLDRNAEFANREFIHPKYQATLRELIDSEPALSPDEVRGVGEWEDAGKQMVINLENAREQYSALGYPHRTELKRRCSLCRKITLVDASIEYRYCPHCGARMKVSEDA